MTISRPAPPRSSKPLTPRGRSSTKQPGKSVFGPQQISAIFTGLPGLCGQGQTFFWTDPIVLYDQIANRWIISQIAADSWFSTGNECIAVSESFRRNRQVSPLRFQVRNQRIQRLRQAQRVAGRLLCQLQFVRPEFVHRRRGLRLRSRRHADRRKGQGGLLQEDQ